MYPVAILRCRHYDQKKIIDCLDRIAATSSFVIPVGAKVLLKPNLVSGRGHTPLACSQPEFVAAVAKWCLDHGAQVSIGDSPAIGRATSVMRSCGISAALQGLPVQQVHFSSSRRVTLSCGRKVGLASAALEADLVINLPRVKAHSQTLVTLAVKNYFGCVKGFRKALLHQSLGRRPEQFARMLLELPSLLPTGITFIDGITTMHKTGPIHGERFDLGLVAGAVNPVALDTALLSVLAIAPEKSIICREAMRQKLAGSTLSDLFYPLLSPQEVAVKDFVVPSRLTPIPFAAPHVCASIVRRVRSLIRL